MFSRQIWALRNKLSSPGWPLWGHVSHDVAGRPPPLQDPKVSPSLAEQPGRLCSLWGLPPRSGPSLTSDLRGITRTLWGGRAEGMLERGPTHTTTGCVESLCTTHRPLCLCSKVAGAAPAPTHPSSTQPWHPPSLCTQLQLSPYPEPLLLCSLRTEMSWEAASISPGLHGSGLVSVFSPAEAGGKFGPPGAPGSWPTRLGAWNGQLLRASSDSIRTACRGLLGQTRFPGSQDMQDLAWDLAPFPP